jgi:acetyl-CoA C-acetyltransferase
MTPIAILSAVRTPIGSFQGGLAGLAAPQLGAAVIRAAVARAGIEAGNVSDVLMGHVLQAGAGQAPARQAALQAGLPGAARCATLNKVCGSGLEAVLSGARALALGESTFVVAGGMESMSNAPYLLPKARTGYRLGHQQAVDSIITDGLWDPYHNLHMGSCAEACARKYGFTREEQDAYAIESFRRANAAQQAGKFTDEIVPVAVSDEKFSPASGAHDEGPARVKYDKIPTLRPAFDKGGTITAANASTLNDGAAALVLTSPEAARRAGRQVLARLVSGGSHAQDPLWFTTAPVGAAQQALARAGWKPEDVDLWEVNEAFAVVPLAFMRELGVPAGKLNVRGGAIALGHPIGASGARILVTLVAALRAHGLRRGVAAVCIGGGEALAACVEVV